VPSVQSSEVHIGAGQSLGFRAEEVNFEFRAKDSLSEGIVEMRDRELQIFMCAP